MFKRVRKWKIVENSGRHALIMDTKIRMNEFLLQRFFSCDLCKTVYDDDSKEELKALKNIDECKRGITDK